MLTAEHKKHVSMEAERAETAEYRRRHGACKPGPAKEVHDPLRATYTLACERGRFELSLAVAADGKIRGFGGESFDLAPSPAGASVAEKMAGMVGSWSDATYDRYLKPEFKKPKDELKAKFEELRGELASCKLGKPGALDSEGAQAFALECAGGDAKLTVRTAAKAPEHVVQLRIRTSDSNKCH